MAAGDVPTGGPNAGGGWAFTGRKWQYEPRGRMSRYPAKKFVRPTPSRSGCNAIPRIANRRIARSTAVCARKAESAASGTASRSSTTTPPRSTEIVRGSAARSESSTEPPSGLHVRQQVLADDPEAASADHPGGLDELAPAQREHLRAHDARRIEPGEEPDHDDQGDHPVCEVAAERDPLEPVAEHEADRDHEEQDREAHDELRHPREDGVDPAAVVAGDQPEDHPEEDGEGRRAERDLERRAASG